MNTLILVALIILLFAGGRIKKAVPASAGKRTATAIQIIFDIIVMVLILRLIETAFPTFWEAWHTPPSFFWITLSLLVLSLVTSATTLKRDYGAVVLLFVIVVILFNYVRYEYRQHVLEKTQEEKMEKLAELRAEEARRRALLPVVDTLCFNEFTPACIEVPDGYRIRTDLPDSTMIVRSSNGAIVDTAYAFLSEEGEIKLFADMNMRKPSLDAGHRRMRKISHSYYSLSGERCLVRTTERK